MGEGGGRKMGRGKLVTIHTDPRIQRLLWRPITIVGFDDGGAINDVELIKKATILCDSCGQQVAVTEKDLNKGLLMGYALCDEGIIEVVCEDCRRRYSAVLRVYEDLEQAFGGELALGGGVRCGCRSR